MRTAFGTITQTVDDHPRFNGEAVDLSRYPDVPRGVAIEAAFADGDDNVLADWQYDLSSWPEREKIPFRVAIAWHDDRHDPEEYRKAVEDRLIQICQNRWAVEVRLYDVSELPHGGWDLDTFDYRTFARVPDEDGFDATHYMFVGGWGTGNCGRAKAGGQIAMARPNCGSETGVHELLHNGANRHVHVIHSGIPGDIYGEIGVLMARSTGGARDDVSTPHLYQMQLIEENNVKELVAGESDIFFLVQGSSDPLALAAGEDKAVMCMRPGRVRRLMISYHDDTIRIHRPGYDYSTLFRQTTLLKRLHRGQVATIEGVTVAFMAEKDGAAQVYVNNERQNATDPVVGQFPRWTAPENAFPIDETRNGIWRNPAWDGSGQGVQVRFDPKENELVVHWLGWSRLGYKPQYRWLRAHVREGCARGRLVGTDMSGAAVETGGAIIHWYDDATGIFRAYDAVLGRFALPLRRLGLGMLSPLNGYYGMGDGHGLSISVLATGQVVGYWLMPEQKWRLVQGFVGQELSIYEVSGGMLSTPVQISKEKIGSAWLEDGVFRTTLESDRALDRLA